MNSNTIQRANAALVIAALCVAVLPAIAVHAMTAIMLMVATPAFWLAYLAGWWGLISLLRVFASFVREAVQIGPATMLGLVAGSAAVIALLWPILIGLPACSACEPPDFFAYRPNLFCVAIAGHWSFLHYRGFRLVGRSSEPASDGH